MSVNLYVYMIICYRCSYLPSLCLPRFSARHMMAAVVIKWDNWDTILFGGFYQLLDDNVLCDTILMGSDGLTRPAHSFILAAASPVLRTQLITNTHTEDKYIVYLDSISGHAWELVLQFVYNGQVSLLNKLEAECIIKAAEQLEMHQLRLVGEQYLLSQKDVVLAVKTDDDDDGESLAEDKPAVSFDDVIGELLVKDVTRTNVTVVEVNDEVDEEQCKFTISNCVDESTDEKEAAPSGNDDCLSPEQTTEAATKSDVVVEQQLNEDEEAIDGDDIPQEENVKSSGLYKVISIVIIHTSTICL